MNKLLKECCFVFIDVYKDLCARNGKAVTTVARELGISSRTAADWIVKGSEPRPSTKKKIADYFGVDVSVFETGLKEHDMTDDVDELRELLHRRPELKTLLSAGAKVTAKDIRKAVILLEMMNDED